MSADDRGQFVTELRARGYAVLPAPREVELGEEAVRIDAGWRLTHDVDAEDVAVRTLTGRLRGEHDLTLAGAGGGTIHLTVRPGAVQTGAEAEIDRQGYVLTVEPDRVEVAGNSPVGLFYGVQTLLQLLAGDGRRRGVLPEGVIRDWPRYQLRMVHWDTKHHQDRVETLKRFLDWTAAFKCNAICFELEDKFEYPSHPVIGAPGAFTTSQMQELVAYGLARYVQIVPNVQSPAHMCYVLKHPEFEHLRCDGSNYQSCMDDPEVRKLIFDMYDDACEATEGVEYFHVSTDEVYYAGICEKYRKPYNPTNRSLTWVDFVQAAHAHLSEKGRRVIIWAEYPLLPEHVKLLPPDVLDGIIGDGGDPGFVEDENALGIRQFAYCPIQGEEKLFPNYFAYQDRDGRRTSGRLESALEATTAGKAARGNPIGALVTAWDDAGLHNETFWLGFAAMAQGGWTPGAASIEQNVADFMDVFYGREVADMVEVYRDLQQQVRFWEFCWDHRASKVRGPGYGYSAAKRPVNRTDWTLLPPGLPRLGPANREDRDSGPPPDLGFTPAFTARYERMLSELPQRLGQSDRLIGRLQANLPRARRNRYNLEVLLSLAYFVRHFLEMLSAVAAAERMLGQGSAAAKAGRAAQAVGLMVRAHELVAATIDDLYATFERLKAVWEKSQFPKNAPVGGREFFHVMDDVKDHFADRRADLSYMIAPEEGIELPAWRDALGEVIRSYAKAAGLPVAGLPEPPMDD